MTMHTVRCSNMCKMGVPEQDGRAKGKNNYLKKSLLKISPNLLRSLMYTPQNINKSPRGTNARDLQRHTTVKMLKDTENLESSDSSHLSGPQ